MDSGNRNSRGLSTMKSTTFGDLTQNYTVKPLEAAAQIETLFRPLDTISISGKKNSYGANKVLTQFIKAKDFVEEMRSPEGTQILQDLCFSPEPMDLYFGLGTVSLNNYRGPYHRVREIDIQEVRVLYADLDVKPGSFNSREHAYTWIIDLCSRYNVPPSYIANSGSGGLHVYWKLKHPPKDQKLDAKTGKELSTMWWAWLQDMAGDIHIDKLVDMARMSRIAGSIHWPKEYGEEPGLVRGSEPKPDNIIDPVYILNLCADSYKRLKERREVIRNFEKENNLLDLSKLPSDMDLQLQDNTFFSLYIKASIEPWFDENCTWDMILGDAGWTFLREDALGRREWARPGRSTKSAVVDWPDSPNIMSLLSTSTETGLNDLLDAGVPLTKWRVFVRLYFRDNFEEAQIWAAKKVIESLKNGEK